MKRVGSYRLDTNKSSGFTIVELLIVIIVIGILAAIIIVAYNGIQAQAKLASYKSAAESILKKAAVYNASQGAYPLCANAAVTDFNSSTDAACSDKAAQLVGLSAFYYYDATQLLNTATYDYTTTSQAVDGAISGIPANTFLAGKCGTGGGTGFAVVYPDPVAKTNVMVTTGSGC